MAVGDVDGVDVDGEDVVVGANEGETVDGDNVGSAVGDALGVKLNKYVVSKHRW